MFAVDIDEQDERVAIAKALEMVKLGQVVHRNSDCRWLGLQARESPPQSTRSVDVGWLVRALLSFGHADLRRVALTAGLIGADESIERQPAWIAELLNRAKQENKLVDLNEAARSELAAKAHQNSSVREPSASEPDRQ